MTIDDARRRVRRHLKLALFSLSDRLCAWAGAGTAGGVRHRWLFEAGHQAGELGWRLRRPGRVARWEPTKGGSDG